MKMSPKYSCEPISIKITAPPMAELFFWHREKDSNPHRRSQSPACYLYTIPVSARSIIHDLNLLSSNFSKKRAGNCSLTIDVRPRV